MANKPITTEPSKDARTLGSGETFRRREMPHDVELPGGGTAGPRDQNRDADKDYLGNFKKFERHDDMSAPPTRDKAGEPGHNAARSKGGK